ncbi:MAG: hypothetical protein U9Q69_03850 [Nanoarchaeota archaeon]|nr:hypothetical protein [Nanoarchaeota archaeon]
MKKITALEWRRQLFHALFGIGLVITIYYKILNLQILLIILLSGLLVSIISRHHKLPFVSWLLKKFDRPKSIFPGEGAFFLILGSVLVLAVFPKYISLASLLILALGDSMAHLIGKSFGKTKFANKTLMGTLAGIITGFLGALIFVSPITALLGSGVAMLFEAFEIRILGFKIDDNLFIPVVSSIIMYIWMVL